MTKREYLGEFEQAVLLSLARLKKDASGREIFDELVEVTGREAAVAAVHITLNRMAQKGFVSSYKESGNEGGRKLKLFTLEAEGAAAVRNSFEQLNSLWQGAELQTELEAK